MPASAENQMPPRPLPMCIISLYPHVLGCQLRPPSAETSPPTRSVPTRLRLPMLVLLIHDSLFFPRQVSRIVSSPVSGSLGSSSFWHVTSHPVCSASRLAARHMPLFTWCRYLLSSPSRVCVYCSAREPQMSLSRCLAPSGTPQPSAPKNAPAKNPLHPPRYPA